MIESTNSWGFHRAVKPLPLEGTTFLKSIPLEGSIFLKSIPLVGIVPQKCTLSGDMKRMHTLNGDRKMNHTVNGEECGEKHTLTGDNLG
jgi:hypothetical protein